MSSDWPTVPLEKVVTHRKEFITINDSEKYKRCRVRLHAQGIVLRDIVSGSEIKTKLQQVCRAGEFLVAEIDAKVGGFGVLTDELDGAIVSSHYFLFTINDELLDRRFLDYFIRTPSFREQVSAQGSTNYAAIRPYHVLGYKLPLPPLNEQQRIAARIENLATKIEEARGLRQKTVSEVQLLWSSASQQALEVLAKYGKQSLGKLVTMQGGGTPSKSNREFWDGNIPWVSPKDMKQREINDATDHISEAAINSSPAKVLTPGCVLIVVRGMILSHTVPSAVLNIPATINQDIKALSPVSELDSKYLCYVLWASNRQLLELVDRSSHGTCKLRTEKLLSFGIPLPSHSEQQNFIAYIDDLQAKINSLKGLQSQTAAELDAILPAVLDKAFKGEL